MTRGTNKHIAKFLNAICWLVIFCFMCLYFYNLLLSFFVSHLKQHIQYNSNLPLLTIYNQNCKMLNSDRGPTIFQTPDGVWSPAQWFPFDIYEWFPRFPRYAPNPFMFNHPSYYYYQIAWYSKYHVVFPHSYSYRMLRAVSTNNMGEIIQLLEDGFPVDHTVDKKYGYNALQLAAMTNHFPLIELLVLRGADINRKDNLGNTPIMIAVANQNHQAIHSLLRNGSDLTIKNNYGLTAIDKANDIPSIQKFLTSFNQKKRNFPRFSIKLNLQKMLRNSFWDQVKNMKIYTNKVTQNPLSRWQFDFNDYRQVSQMKNQLN